MTQEILKSIGLGSLYGILKAIEYYRNGEMSYLL